MIGMSEAEFYETTPRYFYNRLKGWNRAQEIEHNRHRWEMELNRAILSYQFNMQVDRMHRKAPGEIFPLPWDEKKKEVDRQAVIDELRQQRQLEIPIDQF